MQRRKKKRYRLYLCLCLAAAAMLLLVMSSAALAKTAAGTTSRNASKYDFNCVYTLTNDTANKRYTLKVTAQLKILKYKFSTTQTHKVNIKINGTTYTKTFDGMSGGDNATTVAKSLYTKSVNFSYASAARSIPISITTTDIASGGYGPGICKASAAASIPAVTETKVISGSVIWKDNDDQDGLRSARTISIKRDGTVYTTRSTSGAWSASVPVYKAGGGTSVYTIDGNTLTGYTGPVLSGFNLTYTRSVFDTIRIKGAVQWEDSNDLQKKRPAYILVNLLKNGKQEETKTVKPDASGNWNYDFGGLPKNEKGSPVTYTVSTSVPFYETIYDGWNIINTCIPEFGVRVGFSI